jgi:RimJ/RimL family protein N-acetyltransferase
MDIKLAGVNDIKFVFECLKELRGEANYTLESFKEYFIGNKLDTKDHGTIYIMKVNNKSIGMATVNINTVPRYIGLAAELEEMVIINEERGKQYAKLFLEKLIKLLFENKNIRRFETHTDNEIHAEKIYPYHMTRRDSKITFIRQINTI